jgi:hypothetical protein
MIKVLQHQKLLPGRWDGPCCYSGKEVLERFGAKPIELMYNTQLKVTISRYYTPSGRCIQALDYAHKDKMEQPLEPMKIITALKPEKEAFMTVAAS